MAKETFSMRRSATGAEGRGGAWRFLGVRPVFYGFPKPLFLSFFSLGRALAKKQLSEKEPKNECRRLS
jgi:hypothetical protein